jgi:hypothetical protein
MANLIMKLVCAWLKLTGYLSVLKVESQRLFTFKKTYQPQKLKPNSLKHWQLCHCGYGGI